MKRTYTNTCNKLNKLLPATKETIDNINQIIFNEVFNKKGGLYWDRELWLFCGADEKKIRKMIYTDKVEFTQSLDKDEHPGIVFKFKPGLIIGQIITE